MNATLFVVLAVLGLLAALGTVLNRNLIHAALYLVAFFFVVACQFVLLEAEFLAAVQVLIYVGAVSILLMFGIMLTRNVQGDLTTTIPRHTLIPALLVSLGLFAMLCVSVNDHRGDGVRPSWVASRTRPPLTTTTGTGTADRTSRAVVVNDMGRAVGRELLTRHALAFELAGLLLTVALVGAVVLAHRESDDTRTDATQGRRDARTSDLEDPALIAR